MLQMFHLNVLKVEWVLYLPHRFILPRLGVSSTSLDAGDVRVV
jgi:hypothetical protein